MSQLINSESFHGLTLSVVGTGGGGGGGGVSKITSNNGSITLSPSGGTGVVDLTAVPSGVQLIKSTNGTLTITREPFGVNNLAVNFPEPSGVQSITSTDGSITITSNGRGVDDLSINNKPPPSTIFTSEFTLSASNLTYSNVDMAYYFIIPTDAYGLNVLTSNTKQSATMTNTTSISDASSCWIITSNLEILDGTKQIKIWFSNVPLMSNTISFTLVIYSF